MARSNIHTYKVFLYLPFFIFHTFALTFFVRQQNVHIKNTPQLITINKSHVANMNFVERKVKIFAPCQKILPAIKCIELGFMAKPFVAVVGGYNLPPNTGQCCYKCDPVFLRALRV